ncbi:MAG: hypothetical protein IPH64_09780 [Comamonadaceae bacterium]|nr:hypothetical protein [Comamonadaceae bacterium]
MVQQRAAVGIQAHARQCCNVLSLVGRQLVGAQHVKADADRSRLRPPWSAAWRSRRASDRALQRHLVRRRFRVHHHQVAGQAAPGPQAHRLRQRTQQAQPLCAAGGDENQRPVAREAEAPEQAPVADRPAPRPSAWTAGAGEADQQRRGQVCTAAKFSG